MRTIAKNSKNNEDSSNNESSNQSAPGPMKTDQEILDELKQASGGERRRSFGLTAFIVLLAIVIAVFTWTSRRSDDNNNNEVNDSSITESTENNDADNNNEITNTEETTENTENNATINSDEDSSADTSTDSEEAEGEEPNEDSSHSKDSYTEVAQVGEGVTHLARRATAAYLSTKNITDLNAEQKIFIEDYLAKQAGYLPIDIGTSQTFEVSAIDQAVTQARALTDAQLQNLEQYALLVPGL